MTTNTIHLVLGDTAAGVLREAMACGVVPAAEIVRFRDIYCLGPLGALDTPAGPASRAAYWAELLPAAPPPVADFEAEEARYLTVRQQAATASPLLWVGAHSSAQLWLQRLAAGLAGQVAVLRAIDAFDAIDANETRTGTGGRRALSQFPPPTVGGLLARERALGAADLAALAQAWKENATVASGVRRWRDGRITHHADDFYDELLLAQCDRDWQPAEQVVGSAQWDCDEFLGDVFFAWRLRCLGHAGRVHWQGPRETLKEAMVRLPGGNGGNGGG